MKRRLFAAAMAMTMVMGASVPVMAQQFTSAPNGSPDVTIDVKATVVGTTTNPVANGTNYDETDDSGTDIWDVTINATDLTYNLDKTTQQTRVGDWGVHWDHVNHIYTTGAKNSTYAYTYALHSGESADRSFTIKNDSNFALGVDYGTGSGTNWDASAAITGLSDKTIAVGAATVQETVTLVPGSIPADVNIVDANSSIGNITIDFSAGDRATYNP